MIFNDRVILHWFYLDVKVFIPTYGGCESTFGFFVNLLRIASFSFSFREPKEEEEEEEEKKKKKKTREVSSFFPQFPEIRK